MRARCFFCKHLFTKKYSAQRFCSITCSNRYNLNGKVAVITPRNYDNNLAEFFGILLGDGSTTEYFTRVYLNRVADKPYASFVTNLAKQLFPNIPVRRREKVDNGTIEIQISVRGVGDYLRKTGFNPKTRKVPVWITKNQEFSISTMRGLFDTEGSVGIKFFHGKKGNYFYKQLTVTNTNKNILNFLRKTLSSLGFHPTRTRNKNIYISNRKDIYKYMNIVGSHNPKLIKRLITVKIHQFTYGGLRRMVRHQS